MTIDRTIETLDFAEGIQPEVTRAARFDADGDVS
jgi:hypothetical protein